MNKRKLLGTALAVVLFGASLSGCAASSTLDSTTHEEPAVQEIVGADQIKVRVERLENNVWLYCIDELAYLAITGSLTAAPQYDSKCALAR